MFLYVELSLFTLLVPMVSEAEPWTYLLNFGALGVFTLMWAFGKIHSDPAVQKMIGPLERQITDLRETNRMLTNAASNAAIPALSKATEVVRETTRRNRGLTQEQLESLVERLELQLGNGDET